MEEKSKIIDIVEKIMKGDDFDISEGIYVLGMLTDRLKTFAATEFEDEKQRIEEEKYCKSTLGFIYHIILKTSDKIKLEYGPMLDEIIKKNPTKH